MRFREVLLVILLIAAGLILYQVKTGRWDLNIHWDEDFFFLGSEYVYEETAIIDAPLPSHIEVSNTHGRVEIEGTETETAHLTFVKRIWRKNEDDARAIADRLRYLAERGDDTLRLSTNRAEFTKRNFETEFILKIPNSMTVTVSNSYGSVKLTSVAEASVENKHGRVFLYRTQGPASIENSYGDVEVEDIGAECLIVNKHADVEALGVSGDLRIENRYGLIKVEDAAHKVEIQAESAEVRARRIEGDLEISTSYEDITLTDVGPTRIRARHSPVDADGVAGDLDIETSYEHVLAIDVTGNFAVKGKSVSVAARNIKGREVFVDTSYEKVDIADFAAETSINVESGSIVLSPASLDFPMTVQNRHANITFFWPPGEEAPLEARSKGGSIRWELAREPSLNQTNGTALLQAFVGRTDKPQILLTSDYGDILIKEPPREF